MKTLNINLEDREFRKIKNLKEQIGIVEARDLSWRDFLLRIAELHDEIENGKKKNKSR